MSKILSISEKDFETIVGKFEEPVFYSNPKKSNMSILREMMTCDSVAYRQRDEIEEDPSVKQLIPYVVFLRGTEVFRYYRTQKCGEERLRAKSSIGIGGHIEEVDGPPSVQAYCQAVCRECKEEIDFDFPAHYNPLESIQGFLYDPLNPVGQVHVGVVHVIQLGPKGSLHTQEDVMSDGRFQGRSALKREVGSFELWSQLIIPTL